LTPRIAIYGTGPIASLTAAQIWSKHVRFIGAGAVAAAGIVAVARALPTMWRSFSAVIKGLRHESAGEDTGAPQRTDRDIPPIFVAVVPVAVGVSLAIVRSLVGCAWSRRPRLGW